ncbi:MAG: C40 family peptidase [Candidatus Peregrinibacteria bacterium]
MSSLENFVAYCQGCLGKPYILGNEGPDSYDCSGLPYAAAKAVFGKTIPRVSTDQYSIGAPVEKKDLIRGDFVFFDTGWTARKPNHVGIYLGNDAFLNANSYHGKTVQDSLSSSYWTGCWYGARRVFTENGEFFSGSVVSTATNMGGGVSPHSFPDVPQTHPDYAYITDLATKGVVQGDATTGNLRPYDSLNRAEALKMVLLSAKISVPTVMASLPFSDTSLTGWYAPYIKAGIDKGIITGYSDNTFRPENPVSRSEAVKMIFLALGIAIVSKPGEQWDTPYLVEAKKRGMLIPEDDGDLRGAQPITRSEMCRAVGEL